MSSFTMNAILEKTESRDKDFRYMATSDLLAELSKESFKPDSDSERKMCRCAYFFCACSFLCLLHWPGLPAASASLSTHTHLRIVLPARALTHTHANRALPKQACSS